jgi:hypothetical protein
MADTTWLTGIAAPTEPRSATPNAAPRRARTMVWGLEAGGWTEREAGNIVALLHGIKPLPDGWTFREIEHLRFLRAIVRDGRVDP